MQDDKWPPANQNPPWIYEPCPLPDGDTYVVPSDYMVHLFRHPHESEIYLAAAKARVKALAIIQSVIAYSLKHLRRWGIEPDLHNRPVLRPQPIRDEDDIHPDFESGSSEETIVEQQTWVYHSTAKKSGDRLTRHVFDPPLAWGLRFEEGVVFPVWITVPFWTLIFSCVFGTLAAALALAIKYGIAWFGIVGPAVAICALAVALIKVISG